MLLRCLYAFRRMAERIRRKTRMKNCISLWIMLWYDTQIHKYIICFCLCAVQCAWEGCFPPTNFFIVIDVIVNLNATHKHAFVCLASFFLFFFSVGNHACSHSHMSNARPTVRRRQIVRSNANQIRVAIHAFCLCVQ